MTQFHHRVKTHGAHQVKQPFPGIFVWRDPRGRIYVVDHTSTRKLGKTARADATAELTAAVYSGDTGVRLDYRAHRAG